MNEILIIKILQVHIFLDIYIYLYLSFKCNRF